MLEHTDVQTLTAKVHAQLKLMAMRKVQGRMKLAVNKLKLLEIIKAF